MVSLAQPIGTLCSITANEPCKTNESVFASESFLYRNNVNHSLGALMQGTCRKLIGDLGYRASKGDSPIQGDDRV